MATTTTVETSDGIRWHVERQGRGPDLILVPSGEGDCASFAPVVAALASSFTVTTFDMPGMSRSQAPESAMENLTAVKLAGQVVSLIDRLSITLATFYGCSSGGLIVLALASSYSNRVRSAIVHEVPLAARLGALTRLDDAAVVEECHSVFPENMIEDQAAWDALGADYHARLDKNFVTWVRRYVDKVERSYTKTELTTRPVRWTVGASSRMGMFFDNVTTACDAGISISLLPCAHFPQVTIPQALAEHIRNAAMEHL